MKRLAILFTVLLCCSGASSSKPLKRPPIVGIAHVRIRVTDLKASSMFLKELGFYSTDFCVDRSLACIPIGGKQYIELDPGKSQVRINYVEEVGFLTTDIAAMRKYLHFQGLRPTAIRVNDRSSSFSVADPEGNRVGFVQQQDANYFLDYDPRVSKNLIHAGFVVKDLAAENRFYIDLLGFRLYWHGGFKDDGEDWYELQVPDGTDWIEYMLNIPADADRKELGIQNHFSLGVKDIHATAEQLHKNGIDKFDGPEIGRDGKWALDVYDPDGTRIEFMEFTPAHDPCCHPYTAPHPKP